MPRKKPRHKNERVEWELRFLREFQQWQKSHRLSDADAAKRLGVTVEQAAAWRVGIRPPSRQACEFLLVVLSA